MGHPRVVSDQHPGEADTRLLRVADGRRLAYCAWGDPAGDPVVYLHGVPGSRYLRHPGRVYADVRLRVITYDRPGYGLSDPSPGRTVSDTAADVVAIADDLGLERFAVAGVSAGGVHALSVAALFPDRVSRCVGIKALAPFDAEGLDFYDGMGADEAEAVRQLASGGRPALEDDARAAARWVEIGCPGLDMPEPVAGMLRQAFGEAFRQGLDGHVGDWAAHLKPHGYDLAAVGAPTLLLAARSDESVPPAHARWLASRLPDPRLTWVDGGHLDADPDTELRAFVWAARGEA